MGMDYERGMNRQRINDARALACFQQSALHGFAVADGYLAYLHWYGYAGLAQDKAKGAEMAKKAWPKMVDAAERGDAAAQLVAGICHLLGHGVPENKEEAFKWFTKSAAQGNAHGQRWLGECHYRGHGVPENKEEAFKWFTKSAAQGNAHGQLMMGECHYRGHGVPENKEEALKYYRLAAQQGNALARSRVEELEKQGVK
jgi:TPR repeat protein